MGIFAKILAFLLKCLGINRAKTENETEAKPVEAPKERVLDGKVNSISFYPSLVTNLKADHQNLLNLYVAAVTDAKNHKFETISEQLAKFKSEFVAHLHLENTKFYGFLEQRLEQNTKEHRDMRSFRKDMRMIEKDVGKFLDTWIEVGVDKTNVDQFLEQSDGIAEALVKRIQSEEEGLYPIYENSIPQNKAIA